MENEKFTREKIISAVSLLVLTFAVIAIFIVAATIIFTKGKFTAVLTEMVPNELPVITKLLVVSTPSVAYGIFFASLILMLVLKELFLRNKRVTLVVNLVLSIGAILFIPVYMIAIFLPMISTLS